MAAVKITVGADLSPAQKEITEFQSATAAAAKTAGQSLSTGIEQGATKAGAAIRGVGNAADQAAKSAKSIEQSISLGDKIGMVGALQAQITGAIGPMLGLSDATNAAVGKVGGLVTQGANLGKAFGPIPALFGGLIGGALGVASVAVDHYRGKTKDLITAKIKLEEATRESAKAESNYRAEIEKNGVAGIEVIQTRIKALKAEALAEQEVKKAGGSFDWASHDMRVEEIEKKFGDLADTAGAAVKSTTDLKKELGLLPKDTLEQIEKAAGRTKKSFEDADKKVADLKAELDKIDSRNVDLLQEKTDELEGALDDQKKTAVAAKEANDKFTIATKEAAAAAAAAKPPLAGAAGAYKDIATEANKASTAITEVVVSQAIVIDETTGKIKTNLVNLAFYYDEAQVAIVKSIKAGRDELDALTGPSKTPGQIKAETDDFLASMEPAKIPVEIEVDPSDYDAALDKVENFGTVAKSTFKSAGKDFKEASKQFLTDALAASLDKVAENIAKGEKAYKGLGATIATVARDQILALGKTWAFKAGGEAAEAIAALAFGNLPGAALHGQAALMFGALAAAAGVGAGLIGKALPSDQATAAAPASPAQGATSSSGGPSFGGGSTFQELTPVQYNLAPGGTVVFAGDNRGRAQYGRFTEGSIATGRSATPTLKRT